MNRPFERAVQAKVYCAGTHRATDPEHTWARIEPMLPAFGITRIADVTRLDHIGLPVALAVRPGSHTLSVAQGKGSTWAEARVSAAMEAIECWHAEQPDRPAVIASYREIVRRGPTLAPQRLPLDARTVYHDRLAIPWVDGWDLLNDARTWVPRQLVELDFLEHPAPAPVCFRRSSNGLASGNTRLEASLHALYELIERDASALGLCRQIAGDLAEARVDPSTIDHPLARRTHDLLVDAGFEVAIFDETTDVGVAAFACSIRELSPRSWARPSPRMGGNGAHLDRGVALLRALHEAAQSRLTYISGSRDDISRHDFSSDHLEAPGRPLDELYRLPARLDFRTIPDRASDDLAVDLERVLAALAGVGVDQVVVVDLTDPRFEIPVVRAVAPDLEHLGDDGGGRLGPRARAALGR